VVSRLLRNGLGAVHCGGSGHAGGSIVIAVVSAMLLVVSHRSGFVVIIAAVIVPVRGHDAHSWCSWYCSCARLFFRELSNVD
jgi:hypothetical protein